MNRIQNIKRFLEDYKSLEPNLKNLVSGSYDHYQEELLKEYEQIRKQPGRVGVALLSGSTCRGCHLDLPAVEVDRIKKLPNDTLINCEECSCILVR